MTVLGWTITGDALIVGALSGLAYAVLAAGLVLVYRATKVINFAHGEIGAFGAAVLAKAVLDWGWNFFVALAAVLVAGGALGAMVEMTVVRRLFRAPRLTLLVATIGVSQLVFVMQILLPGIDEPGRYPSPFRGEVELGNIVLRSEHFMVMLFVPAVIAGLGYLLTRTRYGIDIRAAAENPDRAEMLGIDIHRVSTIVWVLAGVLATLTAVLINPMRGTIVGIPSMALGPGLLLRALAAALFGRISSLPRALLGGLIVGVVEAVMYVNVANPGAVDALLFVMVLGTVVFMGDRGAEEDSGGWSLMPKVRAAPERLKNVWWIRRMAWVLAAAGLLVAVAAPMVFTKSADIFMLSRVLIYAMVAVSVTVLTGWSGQLSLGQFAFVGVGAMITASLVARGMPFGAALAYSTVAGVVVAVVVGFPALRVRGLHLAVTTLAFAVASRGYFLAHPLFLGDRAAVLIPRFTWLGIDFSSQRSYYYLCLVALVATTFIVSRIRATGVGRSMIAVRDNEAAAASFTISPSISKLTAFAVSGGCAALAGALLGGLQSQFGPAAFPPDESLRVVAMTVIGGLGSIGGALLGALYVVGIPALFDDNVTVGLLTSAIGLLVLLLYLPGGLAGLAFRVRDALLARVEARQPEVPTATGSAPQERGALPATARRDRPDDLPALRATNISLAFGGVRALENVSIEARQGEVVGLIGSNGAGKSTLMNVIGGYARADSGHVEFFGEDVTDLPPHIRARSGVGRVFQDARLFGDLTLEETVKVALEAHERSEFVPSVLALAPSRRAERAKAALAKDYIAFLGLGAHAGSFLSELSTGTRRIVELCCLLAQRPDLLLLDEPTAGVAQREAEAFGPLIKMIQAELHATVVIIEHDLPLVMGMSDRVYCLAAGTQIAEGLPSDVRSNPAVIAAYLGTDERAIQRSGATGARPKPAVGRRAPRTKPLESAR